MASPEKQNRPTFREKTKQIVSTVKDAINPPPIPRDELLRGIELLEDPDTFTLVHHMSSKGPTSGWDFYIKNKLALKKSELSSSEASEKLLTLAECGFVKVMDFDAQEPISDLTNYTLTRKGRRIFKAITSA